MKIAKRRYRPQRLFFSLTKQSQCTSPKEKQFYQWVKQALLFIDKQAEISLLLCDEKTHKPIIGNIGAKIMQLMC